MFLHSPIFLHDLTFVLPHKVCFEGFSAHIAYGDKIALMGANGCGKSTLLKALYQVSLANCQSREGGNPELNLLEPAPVEGQITLPPDACVAYVPQMIPSEGLRSGGERFNAALTEALSANPNMLLLDEPTNHLDGANRRSLMGLLKRFQGTLLMATHDVVLLREVAQTLWHVDQERINVFTGNYDDYVEELAHQRGVLERELGQLSQEKKHAHASLMQEQVRAKTSRAKGEKHIAQRKYPTIVSSAKARRGQETAGRKSAQIQDKRDQVMDRLGALRLPEVLRPTFHLSAENQGPATLVQISEGAFGYGKTMILRHINLSVGHGERVAIEGNNGSGKTTLIRAILKDPEVIREGQWFVPDACHVGYLDQHYNTLGQGTVLSALAEICPTWSHAQLRAHLNDFLFRKNEEVNAPIAALSGGEKARASLALIAAKPPQLLILDEVTNNLDLETRDHVIQVLKDYPGALILISHDADFLNVMNVGKRFVCGG
jgi:ATPase subunit of ABC transporter with duplicated ATPase domains